MDRFCKRGRQYSEKLAHAVRSLQDPVVQQLKCFWDSVLYSKYTCTSEYLNLVPANVYKKNNTKFDLTLQHHLLKEDYLHKKCKAL